MKIQSLAVIFAIIVLPLVIILSYYLTYEIKTISLQTSYDTKLINATYDAMAAFELNTANEDLSSVADSLRSIIDASTSVFFNTLATNLGMSNASLSYVQPYIPAILYTLYDGYYIYSPTRVTTVLVDEDENILYVGDPGITLSGTTTDSTTGKKIGIYEFDEDTYKRLKESESDAQKNSRQNTLYTNLSNSNIGYEYGQMLYLNDDETYSVILNENTNYTQDYILKSFMPYSARYTGTLSTGAYDLTINYTLDNYLSIEGNIGDIYYSKTGYLISEDVVQSITAYNDSVTINDLLSYNEETAEEMCLSGEYNLTIVINPIDEDGNHTEDITITYSRYVDSDGNILSSTALQEYLDKLYEDQDSHLAEIQQIEYDLANLKAITYYVRSQIFSNWVYDNLGGANGIKASDIEVNSEVFNQVKDVYSTEQDADGNLSTIFQDYSNDNTIIFDSSQNPEQEDSSFYSHKLGIIKNSIQYNLNLALSSYDIMASELDIEMPVITDEEWDKILTQVSVVAFMQGWNCGLKIYNNYTIVSSTNNELSVIPGEIYYTTKSEYNDANSTYHRIDCEGLMADEDANGVEDDNAEYISFKSNEIKYDKNYNSTTQKYEYDHRNLGCYTCIVGGNFVKTVDSSGSQGYSDKIAISALSTNKKKAYFTAVAKERQNLYKTNALTDSNGTQTLYNNNTGTTYNSDGSTANSFVITTAARDISKIREIEVTVKDVTCTDSDAAKVVIRVNFSGHIYTEVTLNLQSTAQTFTIPVHEDSTTNINTIQIEKVSPESDNITCTLLNVRAIYE